MDDHRSHEPLTDGALDREIAAALAVDPSPEFLVRVRQRIAAEPAPAKWRMGWIWIAAGATAAALIVAVALWPFDRKPAVDSQTASVLDARPFAGVGVLPAVHPPPVVSGFSRTMVAPSAAVSRTLPEVLIDPREGEAVRALMSGIRTGRIDLTPLARAHANAQQTPAEISDLVIEPLAVADIPFVPSAEGVRQ